MSSPASSSVSRRRCSASRPGLVPALKDETFACDGRSRRVNLKKVLVVAEVALSLLLLIAAGLFIRSLKSAQTVDPGFDAETELVSAPLNVNLLRYTRAQGRDFYQRDVERVEALPGVEVGERGAGRGVAGRLARQTIASKARDSGERGQSEGGGLATGADRTRSAQRRRPELSSRRWAFRFVRGRDFESAGHRDAAAGRGRQRDDGAAVLPGEDPIGKRFSDGGATADGPWREIVGIVRDSKYATLSEAATPVVYVPLAQNHETGMTLHVRAPGSPAALVAAATAGKSRRSSPTCRCPTSRR